MSVPSGALRQSGVLVVVQLKQTFCSFSGGSVPVYLELDVSFDEDLSGLITGSSLADEAMDFCGAITGL